VVLIPWAFEKPGDDPLTGGGNMAKGKKAFGGYSINFKGCKDSMESVMGASPIGPSEMTKKIWGYVKKKKLANKK
jgi:hypothetical protein